jgi:hypothetical protein
VARFATTGQRGGVTFDSVNLSISNPDMAVEAIAARKTGLAYLERWMSNIVATVITVASMATVPPAPHAHQTELGIDLPLTLTDPFGMSVPRTNSAGTKLTAVSHFSIPGIALRF